MFSCLKVTLKFLVYWSDHAMILDLSDSVAPVLEISEVQSILSLPLLLGPLWPSVVVYVKVLSVDMFKSYLHSIEILDAIEL